MSKPEDELVTVITRYEAGGEKTYSFDGGKTFLTNEEIEQLRLTKDIKEQETV